MSIKTIEELKAFKIEFLQKVNAAVREGQRYGQFWVNLLSEKDPYLAQLVIADPDIDPWEDNKKVTKAELYLHSFIKRELDASASKLHLVSVVINGKRHSGFVKAQGEKPSLTWAEITIACNISKLDIPYGGNNITINIGG